MMKIKALNRDSLSDEDAPGIRREAQEEISLDLYNKALKHQCNENYEEAKSLLDKLLTENIPQLESHGGLPKTMSTMKYCCYFNLGNIYIRKNNDTEALDKFLEASKLDSSDVTLWFKIGIIALKLDKFRQAAYAFIKGLECNESHWPCLDKLISVLYVIQDFVSCLLYIGKALIMDQEYIKGHILRKYILESNPSIKEYYQDYNPDYILEPDFNYSVREEDEKLVIEDIEILSKKLRESEKKLDEKLLPSIGLPTPLKDFTWISLGKTILSLYKYIKEQKLSYLSKIDLTKCMSRESNDGDNVVENAIEVVNENVEVNKSNSLLNNEQQQMEIENLGSEENVERRISLSSENNNLSETNCSPGEDNDEMDQDTEDQEENSEQKEDKKQRSTKRKRDLLSDLQIWGWHSKKRYSKKGKSDKDLTIQDALIRIIPSNLLPKGINLGRNKNFEKCKEGLDDMFLNLKNSLPQHLFNLEKYFGTECEKNDVLNIWTKERQHLDVIDFIEEYTITLAKMWNKKWPKELLLLYLEIYDKYREHFEHPQLFCGIDSFEQIKNDALITLLYGEIVYFYLKREDREEKKIYPASLTQLQLLSSWREQWKEDYLKTFIRIHWLRANVLKELSNHSLAICAYQLIEEAVKEEEENKSNSQYVLYLPNCMNFNIITKEVTQKLLNNLEIIESLCHVQSLYEKGSYEDVIKILKPTFECGSNIPTWGRIGRPAQLGFLLHSLWYTNRMECFIWTEKCLNESTEQLLYPTTEDDKWDMLLCKSISILHEIIKEETVTVVDTLSEENRVRLIENLCRIVTHQLSAEGRSTIPLETLSPWLVLHYILLREEHRLQAKRKIKHTNKEKKLSSENLDVVGEALDSGGEEVPSSIAVLFSAHEFLGNKSWCLTGEGELLHFIIDQILDRLDCPIFEHLREKIDIHLEQAFFCLYQHPSKKNKVSRHLADHNVNPLKLSWERAQQLYEFFCPESLPEFESFKSISISSDLEQLLQRIIALVPSQYDPNPLLPKIKAFMSGNSKDMPDSIDFPMKSRAIYYLLGDYYFKQGEVRRSLKYFMLDLCCNPSRLDSWANLALGLANQLENRLNHCEGFKSEQEFNEEAKSAKNCFIQALKLADNHITLWIEFGSFEYAIHSYYARTLKHESDTISMEMFKKLEYQKEEYLGSSGQSFKKALDLHQQEQVEQDERWLHHYMLGKVAEKRRMDPAEYLHHYLTALELLQENNAAYPEKINYNSPQHLALEVLEIHYRVHAAVLKYLELHEGKSISIATGKIFKKCLDRCAFPEGSSATNQVIEKETNEGPINEKIEIVDKEIKAEIVPEITQLKQEEMEVDIKKTPNESKEIEAEEETKDVIMISDSDDEKSSTKPKKFQSEEEILSPPTLKVKNVQQLMDAVMEKTMNETNFEEIDSDTGNAEIELNKFFEKNKTKFQSEIEQSIKLENKNEKLEEKKTDEALIKNKKNQEEEETKNLRKSVEDTTTCSSSSDSSSSDSESDDSSSTSSTATSSEAPTGFLSSSEIESLINQCVTGLEQYIIRLTQNYKALYRLTHLYFNYKSRKDLSKCRQLLLGQYKCSNNSLVSGLFSDRKTNNFFNGVWRIPSGEIDRPGSLSAHMVRCVTILLQVLRNTNDHKILLDVCLQLRRKPDQDKVYVKEFDRVQLADNALFLCMQSLRTQVKNINNMNYTSAQKFLLDLYRAYQRVQKYIVEKESEFSSMLEEVYKKFMKEKLPENVNALDLAVKFCQQQKIAEKNKVQPQKQPPPPPPPPVLISPTVTTAAPVHPSPITISAIPTNHQSVKRPISIPGRARGRPPGPSKNPGMPRAPRAKSSKNAFNPFSSFNSPMFDSNSLNFAIQYQELLRRYSQLTPLNQSSLMTSNLMQLFTQMTGGNLNAIAQNVNNQMWGNVNPIGSCLPSTSGGESSGFNNNFHQQKQMKTNIQKIPPNKNSTSNFIKKSTTYIPVSKSSTVSGTFKYPSSEVPKMKTKEVARTTTTTTTSDTYISKEIMHSSTKMPNVLLQVEKSSANDMNKITSQITKDRPNISITPVVVNSNNSNLKLATSTNKTLQEKLADKQKHASGKSISFEKVEKHVPIPTFPKESGITVSQITKTQPKQSEMLKSKGEVSTKATVKDFPPISLNITPAGIVRNSTKQTELKRKDSSDDDVIIIE